MPTPNRLESEAEQHDTHETVAPRVHLEACALELAPEMS